MQKDRCSSYELDHVSLDHRDVRIDRTRSTASGCILPPSADRRQILPNVMDVALDSSQKDSALRFVLAAESNGSRISMDFFIARAATNTRGRKYRPFRNFSFQHDPFRA